MTSFAMTHDAPAQQAVEPLPAPSLRDLLEDGIHLLFLLRDEHTPTSAAGFNQRIDQFFANYDKQAMNFNKPPKLVENARYAFCALLDEIMLREKSPLHDIWTRMPLQLRIFKEHLAGEGFFERLDELRADPVANIEALEVFHICLLLGYEGKYTLEGLEKRDSLRARLGNEIRRIRGEKPEFAPNWKLSGSIQNFVRHELPLWFYAGLLALVAAAVWIAFRLILSGKANLILGLGT